MTAGRGVAVAFGYIDLSWISFSIDPTLLLGPGTVEQVVLVSAAFKHVDCELKKGKAWLMTDARARRAQPACVPGGAGTGTSQMQFLPDLQGTFRQCRLT